MRELVSLRHSIRDIIADNVGRLLTARRLADVELRLHIAVQVYFQQINYKPYPWRVSVVSVNDTLCPRFLCDKKDLDTFARIVSELECE